MDLPFPWIKVGNEINPLCTVVHPVHSNHHFWARTPYRHKKGVMYGIWQRTARRHYISTIYWILHGIGTKKIRSKTALTATLFKIEICILVSYWLELDLYVFLKAKCIHTHINCKNLQCSDGQLYNQEDKTALMNKIAKLWGWPHLCTA